MDLGWPNVFCSMTSKEKIFIFSEERTSSTHALTMYRYNYNVNGKIQKIGN